MEYAAIPSRREHIRYYQCAPDLWFPEFVGAEGPAPGLEDKTGQMKRWGQEFRVRAVYKLNPFVLRYLLVSVQLQVHREDLDSDAEFTIDSNTYRALKLEEIQTGLAEAVAREEKDLGDDYELWIALPSKDLGPDPQPDLITAAHAYAKGSVSGRRPQKAVAEELGVSVATAGRRVRAAMDAGYLPVIYSYGRHAEAD